LGNAIRKSSADAETKFLLFALIDLQEGKIELPEKKSPSLAYLGLVSPSDARPPSTTEAARNAV
jgi:hypothetical protein